MMLNLSFNFYGTPGIPITTLDMFVGGKGRRGSGDVSDKRHSQSCNIKEFFMVPVLVQTA